MLIVISPAKTLDLSDTSVEYHTRPDFKKEIKELVSIMKKKKPDDIKALMHVSDNLAELNYARYKQFEDEFSVENSKQALLAFKGDVYTKIDVDNFSDADFKFAQAHLRILSGLYGLLKPLDLIQPYRLEMGVKLANKKGKDLYTFWGDKLATALDQASGEGYLINLASQEYFKAVTRSRLKSKVITPVFKEYRNGDYKIIGLFAKQARGMMTDYAIRNRITDPEQLKLFNGEGYEYSDRLSSEEEWIFVR